MATVPVHVIVLDRLEEEVLERLEAHRVKAGKGLPNDEYQRHVGRIAESEAQLASIAGLRKQLRTDDDLEEHERKTKRRSRRAA